MYYKVCKDPKLRKLIDDTLSPEKDLKETGLNTKDNEHEGEYPNLVLLGTILFTIYGLSTSVISFLGIINVIDLNSM